jgi:DNA-binding NarL/FixJ family response regulator
VALAVANGASNREAAAALFVSPKTIEAQLTSIYRKLDIRSRTQLAKAMHEDALALTG